jgi:hypothetical protein
MLSFNIWPLKTLGNFLNSTSAQNVTLHIKMLDEEKSKHAGLFQQNGLSQFFST